MPIEPRSPALIAALAFAAMLALPVAASAQSADNPPKAQRANTLKNPPRDNKVLGGIERGSDAAGRGIDRAGNATERGVNNASERASRPVRRVGEAFGRKLGGGHAAPPPVGPQGSAP
jgi:hypothetical protein